MTQTTNYQYNIVEGADVVNPLTQLNPNFTSLDNIEYNLNLRVIALSSYSKAGTVHTIIRYKVHPNVSASNMFRFNPTSDWEAGDSISVDGTSYTPILPDGTTPGAGVFVAGTTVIANIVGTKVCFMLAGKYIPAASEVTTAGGDSVQDYIDNTKFKNLETWTPNIGENWETFLARIRDNSTKTIPANFIRCTVDGISGLIFRQSRRTSATSWQYETDYFTGNSLVKYAMSVGSDSAVLRKYDILNGTVQNLSSADAQIINIYGLDV